MQGEEQTERHLSEFGYGRFERSFALPDHVDADRVGATFEHGMLEITLPIAAAAKPRRIEIASGAASADRVTDSSAGGRRPPGRRPRLPYAKRAAGGTSHATDHLHPDAADLGLAAVRTRVAPGRAAADSSAM